VLQDCSKPRFVTLFPDFEDFHLFKDVGMIPHFFGQNGFDPEIVRCSKLKGCTSQVETSDTFPSLTLVGSPKVCTVKTSFRIGGISLGLCVFLWRESKAINILNLYHFSTASKIYGLLFKIRNPMGYLYLKADYSPDFETYQSEQGLKRKPTSLIMKLVGHILETLLDKVVDLVSIEIPQIESSVREKFRLSSSNLVHIPNGLFLPSPEDLNFDVSTQVKEKLIIWAGRVGSFPKNIDLFLKALTLVNFSNWKVVIAGPIDPNYRNSIVNYFQEFPELSELINFTGRALSREELYSLYRRSKILCVSSRWEGFPLVVPEALFFGNAVLSTNLSFARSLSENGAPVWCTEDRSPEAFARALESLMNNETELEVAAARANAYARSHLMWRDIINNLVGIIENFRRTYSGAYGSRRHL
jgi:glycosyltransferase involved in cell wall biosynthesis